MKVQILKFYKNYLSLKEYFLILNLKAEFNYFDYVKRVRRKQDHR